jgi:Arc/MetJ-type ribon-helix-helix transcriptional regulator
MPSQFGNGVGRLPIREPFDNQQVNGFVWHVVYFGSLSLQRSNPRVSAAAAPIVTPAADGCKRLLARVAIGMMIRHTIMPKTKVALTLDSELLERVDELVDRRRFRNRSQAIEAALADKLERLARTRLARESAKLDPREEKRLADEGLAEDFAAWPEY